MLKYKNLKVIWSLRSLYKECFISTTMLSSFASSYEALKHGGINLMVEMIPELRPRGEWFRVQIGSILVCTIKMSKLNFLSPTNSRWNLKLKKKSLDQELICILIFFKLNIGHYFLSALSEHFHCACIKNKLFKSERLTKANFITF